MKKILFILATTLVCFNVQAQIVSSSSSRVVRIVEEKPKKPKKPVKPFETKHYIKGGVNPNFMIATQVYDMYKLLKTTEIPGFHLMYGMEKPFSKNTRWSCTYWGFEAGVSRWAFETPWDNLEGYGSLKSYDWKDEGGWPDYMNICRLGLQFAPKIGFKIGSRGKKFSMGVEVGAYINYNLSSSYALDEYEYDDEEITPELIETSDLLMEAFFNEWNDLEAGGFIGAGFWMGRVYLGLRYSMGWTPSFENDMDKELIEGYYLPAGLFVHQNVYMSIGFAF